MANGPSHLQERFHFIAFFSLKMNIEFIPTDRVGKLYDQHLKILTSEHGNGPSNGLRLVREAIFVNRSTTCPVF